MSEKLTPIQWVKKDMIQDYAGRIAGVDQLLQSAMLVAFEHGLDTAFEWVKEYNEKHREKPRIIVNE